MIEDETLRFVVPKKEPQEFKKKKKDPALYPEDWRKPDIYKGDHVETFDPFQVVRLEEVREKDGYVRVRKLYRPHDTHMSVREARGKPYTYLYWSEEIGRLYTPAKAAQMDKPSMEAVVSRAWVKAKHGGDAEELQDWTDEGEDRFFISKIYDANTKTFAPLCKTGLMRVRTDSSSPRYTMPTPRHSPPCARLLWMRGGHQEVRRFLDSQGRVQQVPVQHLWHTLHREGVQRSGEANSDTDSMNNVDG